MVIASIVSVGTLHPRLIMMSLRMRRPRHSTLGCVGLFEVEVVCHFKDHPFDCLHMLREQTSREKEHGKTKDCKGFKDSLSRADGDATQ